MANIILFIAIFWTFFWTWVNLGRMYYKQSVSVQNNICMCIGWTAIITHIIGIW